MPCYLNYAKMKITLLSHLISYIYQNYIKIKRSHHLNFYMAPLSFCSSLVLHGVFFVGRSTSSIHYNQMDYNQQSLVTICLGWCDCRNFMTANTGFSSLCGMALSPVARCRVSPISNPLNLQKYYFTYARFRPSSLSLWEDERRHIFTLAIDNSEHHDVD